MTELIHRVARLFDGIRMAGGVIAIYGVSSLIAGLIVLGASGLNPVEVFLISSGVTAFAMSLLLLAARLLPALRTGEGRSHYAIFVIVSAVVGAARGALLGAWAAAWDAPSLTGLWAQIVNSSFSAALWMTVAGLLLSGRERYRQQYRSLLIQGAIRGGASSMPAVDLDAHPNVVQARSNLAEALAIPPSNPSAEDLNRVADAIRHEIEFNIRPLSHRLWFSAGLEEPHVRWSRLMRDALTQFTVPTSAVSIIWFISAIIGGSRIFGVDRATISAVVSTAVLVALLVAGRHLAERCAHLGGLWAVVSAVVPIFAADAVSRALGYTSMLLGYTELVILLPSALLALITTSSMIALANADRDVVIEVAERRSGLISLDSLGPRQVSSFLHNSLQSEMTGLAMQLESSAAHGDAEQSREALIRLQSLLERSLMSDLKAMSSDVDGRVSSIIAGWNGICEVLFTVDESIRDDPRMPVAVLAAEELVANSVRHSGATVVEVNITDAAPGIRVTTRANQPLPRDIGDGELGIGTQVLRTLAHRSVHVTDEGAWTRFTLIVA